MQTTRNLNLPAIAVAAGFAVAAVAGCLWDVATGTKCGTEMFNDWNAQPACVRVTCPSRTWCVPGFKYSNCWTEVYTNTCDKAVGQVLTGYGEYGRFFYCGNWSSAGTVPGQPDCKRAWYLDCY
jgi:hypothetical protein